MFLSRFNCISFSLTQRIWSCQIFEPFVAHESKSLPDFFVVVLVLLHTLLIFVLLKIIIFFTPLLRSEDGWTPNADFGFSDIQHCNKDELTEL